MCTGHTGGIDRYRELEEELERVRGFYTRKVEEVQRKGEAQLRALKRGDPHPATGAATGHVTEEAGDPWDAAGAAPPVLGGEGAGVGVGVHEQVQQVAEYYSQRLNLLEQELMNTAEELGKMKAAATAPAASSATTAVGALDIPVGASEAEVRRLVREKELEIKLQEEQTRRREREQLEEAHQQRLQDLRTAHKEHVEQLTRQWGIEREGLIERLRAEQEHCRELQEALRAGVGAAVLPPPPIADELKAPEMRQFIVSFDLFLLLSLPGRSMANYFMQCPLN